MKNLVNYRNLKFFIFFTIICISYWRSPFIFINGRLVAEEGQLHLISAFNGSFFQNLLFYDDVAGYYNLIPNIGLGIASFFPIEFTALITVYLSFIFIVLLPYLCLFRHSHFLDNVEKKILASFILFLSPPFVPEIWINTLNTQVYLCLISIIILFMHNLNFFQKILNNFLVLFGGLSGIYTCSLAPLFLLKFLKNKSHYNFINLIILIFTNLLQLSLIIYSKINNKLHYSVLSNDLNFNSDLIVNFIYNIIFKTFLARQLTYYFYEKFLIIKSNIFLFCILLIFIFFIFFKIYNDRKLFLEFFKKDRNIFQLILIFIIISFIILFGSLNNQFGGRYAVIPGALILLIVLDLAFNFKSSFFKRLFFIMIVLSLTTGLYEFRPPTKNVKHQYLKFLDCINCPIWKQEIFKWKNNNDYEIGLWPYPSKKMILRLN